MARFKLFDVAPKTKKATLIWLGMLFLIGVLTAIKGIGWNWTEADGMWYNPILLAPAYIWIWGGQSLALTVENCYVVGFVALITLLWWVFLAFLIMKIIDYFAKGVEW